MRQIQLNATHWTETEHFFADLLPQLGAPAWHGNSLEALLQGLCGNYNAIKPPYPYPSPASAACR